MKIDAGGPARMKSDKCLGCDGCGQVADTADQEPWSVWTELPYHSAAAILLGLVKPMTCPTCNGSKVVERQLEVADEQEQAPGA